jgi:hypothetical protein
MMATAMISVMASFLACAPEEGDDFGGDNPGGGGASSGGTTSGGTTSGGVEGPKTCREAQNQHVGLGGIALAAGRLDGTQTEDKKSVIVGDRHRVKPFSVLVDDMRRVLGTANQGSMDALINGSADAFGAPPARWFAEPQAGAVSIYTTYRIAFRGCLQYANTVAEWSQQPNATSAAAECSKLQQKAWNVTPSQEEIDACVGIATDAAGFAAVPAPVGPITDAKTKWTYACASVLSSAKFTSF